MTLYSPGQRVQLRSGQVGTITKVLQAHSLAMHTRYQVALEPLDTLVGVEALNVMGRADAKSFFDRQRAVVRQSLGANAHRVEEFKSHLHKGHKLIAGRGNVTVRPVFEEARDPSTPGASVVFMGMKTISAEIVCAIYKYGLTALKYLKLAPPAAFGVDDIPTQTKDAGHAAAMRAKFLLDTPALAPPARGLDEYKLLKIANAHKSGDTENSGLHSTSGKPDYASEYSEASGQTFGKEFYNFGVAIEITNACYPIVIQDGIERWNKFNPTNTIQMAFAKKEETWKRDYESEIMLGGGTPSTDFVYFGVWGVTQKASANMLDLKSQLGKGFALKKTDVNTPKDKPAY